MIILNKKNVFCLLGLLLLVNTATGENLVPNGDFEKKPSYKYLSGDAYYIRMIKKGWDLKVLGPLFWPLPTFVPQKGPAKLRQIEGKDVFQGERCLYIKTWDKDCSFYKSHLIIPETLYDLSFYSKGSGQISFSAYVYKGSKVIECPVFLSVSLTKTWKKSEARIYIENPKADIASLVLNVKPSSELFIDNIELRKSRNDKNVKLNKRKE